MADRRGKLEPPDLSEKGGLRDGQPQRSDQRLFMQLFAFGGCTRVPDVVRQVADAGVEGVIYEDLNDPRGIGLLTLTRDPNIFIDRVRPLLNTGPLSTLTLRPELTMFGRTYSLGYEPDLEHALLERPRSTVLNPAWPWGVWYPLRRSGRFAQLAPDEQRTILAEHGEIGMRFGAADYA